MFASRSRLVIVIATKATLWSFTLSHCLSDFAKLTANPNIQEIVLHAILTAIMI